ncbi:MAG: FAD-binding protein [Thermoplasmata archaeon]|nr:FAD-binding protein [Thermoplasmata archaeon]
MLSEEVIRELKEIVGDEYVVTDPADLYVYGFDASIHHRDADVVVRPHSTEEVSRIVKLANRRKIPIMPRGAGTALAGQAVPVDGGIVIDLQEMNKVLDIRVEDLYVIVQPGVVYAELNKILKPYGFFFPPTPGSASVCTIGGMVAVNASGMRALKYGATRDYVMALEVVLPTGEVVRMGTRTIKNSSGYQLEKLFVGSEGTLGVITEVTLRLQPLPPERAVTIAAFRTLKEAGQGVSNIIADGYLPSALEIMDDVCIDAVNKHKNAGLPQCAGILIVEVEGHKEVVEEDLKRVARILKESGAFQVEYTRDPEEMARIWSARSAVLPALSSYGETFVSVSLADDMSVPISKVADAVVAYREIAKKYGFVIGIYGHAGDGNLHTKFLLDPKSEEHWKMAEKAVGEIYDVTLKLGGTVSGEHGIAITKAPYMKKERASVLPLMKKIKEVIDPNNIMNPRKMAYWENGIIQYLRYPVGRK